jgi:hypothetical protein
MSGMADAFPLMMPEDGSGVSGTSSEKQLSAPICPLGALFNDADETVTAKCSPLACHTILGHALSAEMFSHGQSR